MKWLNLCVEFMELEAFTLACGKDRGTWVSLLKYCAKNENGGRITGGRLWKTRKSLSAVGLEPVEILRTAEGLWSFDGDDVVVEGYPIEQEAKVKANRVNGKKGGRPAEPKKPHGKPHAPPSPKRNSKCNGNSNSTTTNGGDDFGIHPDDLDEYGPAPESTHPEPHPRWNDFLEGRIPFERFDSYLERSEGTEAPANN